jgi:hypothetical protein
VPAAQILIAGSFFGEVSPPELEGMQCTLSGVYHNGSFPIDVTYGHVFPNDNTTLRTTFVATACELQTAHSRIACLMGVGTGREHFWRVSIDGQMTPLSPSESFYAPPFVTLLDGDAAEAARTQGGEWLRINGSNFGTDVTVISRVSYGPTGVEFNATNCSIVMPHTSLMCLTAEGVGAGLGFSIVVDRQESSTPKSTYNAPAIASIPDLQPSYTTRVRLVVCCVWQRGV